MILFFKRAIILGHNKRMWGAYEVATVKNNSWSHVKDAADGLIVHCWCDTDLTNRRFIGPPTHIMDRDMDPDGDYYLPVSVDDVVAFVDPDAPVLSEIEKAYLIYKETETDDAWDTFEVTVRMLF